VFHNWATIVFGWPAVITALLTFSVAVALRSRMLAGAVAILAAR
jgi:hypothetical protein